MLSPLAIDLYCGLGGWTEGLLSEGYTVVGFDIERHVYGDARYPAQLVLQDVLTMHGAQFASADLIVASPPCQVYSYRAMPWKKAKALPPPDNSLFEACFRIQREASEAAGRHIPLVVENVRGAQPWVGRAKWHFGSFYLWGDVPALMPITKRAKVGGFSWSDHGKPGYKPMAFNGEADRRLRDDVKNTGQHLEMGGPKFNRAGVDGVCIHGTHWSAECRECGIWRVYPKQDDDAVKVPSDSGRRTDIGTGARFTSRDCGVESDGFKQGGDWFNKANGNSISRRCLSRSSARKAASAHIAKIPLVLARHIARAWHPDTC